MKKHLIGVCLAAVMAIGSLAIGAYAEVISDETATLNAYTGKAFASYVTEQRVILAKHLLSMNINTNIIDIGMHCGFSSVSSFNRTFKKAAGTTPSAFRKRHIGEKHQ